MGVWQRIRTVFGGKINRVLDQVEDPRETLDFAYAKQKENVQRMRESLVQVGTQKNLLKVQLNRLDQEIQAMERTARGFVAAGQDLEAERILAERQQRMVQRDQLAGQIAQLDHEMESLRHTAQNLDERLTAMRQQKEILKARYTAAQAHMRAQASASQYSTQAEDWQALFERAQDRTEVMAARADALSALAAPTDTTNPLALPSSTDAVKAELARIKAEIAGSPVEPPASV